MSAALPSSSSNPKIKPNYCPKCNGLKGDLTDKSWLIYESCSKCAASEREKIKSLSVSDFLSFPFLFIYLIEKHI
jgi:hypothetical protein